MDKIFNEIYYFKIFSLLGFRPSLSAISGFVIGDKNSAHFNFSGLESIKHKCNAVLPSSSTILGSHLKSEKKMKFFLLILISHKF